MPIKLLYKLNSNCLVVDAVLWCGVLIYVGSLLIGGRGRLTSAANRRKVIEPIGEANDAGAGLVSACVEIGICLRTFKRCRRVFVGDGYGKDRRRGRPPAMFLIDSQKRGSSGSCSSATSRRTPRCRRDRWCRLFRIRGYISARTPAFIGFCTRGTVPLTWTGPAASGTALRGASAGGSPQCCQMSIRLMACVNLVDR